MAVMKKLGESEVHLIDTHGGISHFPALLLRVCCALVRCKNIVILPAQNGLMVISPLIRILNILFCRKLHYVVIGGWLPEFIAERPLLRWVLCGFDGIYVETKTMKKALEMQGMDNVKLMPNCKNLIPLNRDDLIYAAAEPYKLCTFSRVMKEKGIEEAVNAVTLVNTQYGKTVYELDIYGQIDPGQVEWFDRLCKTFPEYVHYKGQIPFDKSIETIKNYFALLFPTYYEGEGFAGTILDGFFSGVPVIASDWKHNGEIIENGYNGVLVPPRDVQLLADKLIELYHAPAQWNEKKTRCLDKAREYTAESVVDILVNCLQ